jgi:8-oxo-dGTP diphosphatase
MSTTYSYIIATVLIENNQGAYLMLVNKKIGKWGLPGGKVELGEQPREAAIREAKEEVGIDVEIISLVGSRDFYWEHDAAYWTELIYRATIQKGEPKIMEPEKIVALGWRPAEDIPKDALFVSTA